MFVDLININIKYIWFQNPNEKFKSMPTSDSKHGCVQIFLELGKETRGTEALALSFCEEIKGKYVKWFCGKKQNKNLSIEYNLHHIMKKYPEKRLA